MMESNQRRSLVSQLFWSFTLRERRSTTELLGKLVAGPGIEPGTPAYETGVLPLHYPAIRMLKNYILLFLTINEELSTSTTLKAKLS